MGKGEKREKQTGKDKRVDRQRKDPRIKHGNRDTISQKEIYGDLRER